MNAITYYVHSEHLWTDESQRALIALWADSWKKQGWTVDVLTEDYIKSHPRFEAMNKAFNAMPTIYPRTYTVACWLRWLAAAKYASEHGGSVMLLDYDVINYGFKPITDELPPAKMSIISNEPTELFLGAVIGSSNQFNEMVETFAAQPVSEEHDFCKPHNHYHQDDLHFKAALKKWVFCHENGDNPRSSS